MPAKKRKPIKKQSKAKRPKLTKKRRELANRLNKVFDLRAEEGLTQEQIGEKFNVSKQQISLYLKILRASVEEKTALLLKKPLTKRELNKIYRLKRIFNLKMQGHSRAGIAKKLGISHTQVTQDLKIMTSSPH